MLYVTLPQEFVVVGMFFMMFTATGSKEELGTWAPAYGSFVAGLIMVLATLLDWQKADSNAEKSPVRAAAVGTKAVVTSGSVVLVPWYPAKKNNLSFRMGPPAVPPN